MSFFWSSAGALNAVDNGRMDKELKQKGVWTDAGGKDAASSPRARALSVKSCLQDYEMWQEWSLHISRVSGGDLSSWILAQKGVRKRGKTDLDFSLRRQMFFFFLVSEDLVSNCFFQIVFAFCPW
jgi:hypothetical protein